MRFPALGDLPTQKPAPFAVDAYLQRLTLLVSAFGLFASVVVAITVVVSFVEGRLPGGPAAIAVAAAVLVLLWSVGALLVWRSRTHPAWLYSTRHRYRTRSYNWRRWYNRILFYLTLLAGIALPLAATALPDAATNTAEVAVMLGLGSAALLAMAGAGLAVGPFVASTGRGPALLRLGLIIGLLAAAVAAVALLR